MAKEGMPIQNASLLITCQPQLLKNRAALNGDTCIPRQGKKWRVLSNGPKNATPRPPVVIASKIPCEIVQLKNIKNNTHPFLEFLGVDEKNTARTKAENITAKNIE